MTSGIIRKVDELGRIVIPKEIRNILHLKEDTPLEISLSGRRIVLDVYSPIPEFKQLSETFVRLMARDLHLPAAICSLDTISYFNGFSLEGERILSQDTQELIQQQHSYLYTRDHPVYLTDSRSCLINALYPIGDRKNPLGAVVLIRKQDTDPLSEHKGIARMMAAILTELTKE